MIKVGKWIAKHKILIIIIGIALLIPSYLGMAATRINYDVLSYLPDTLETVAGQDIMVDQFGMGAFSMIVVEDMELKDVAALKEKIEAVDHVKKVLWYDSVLDVSVPVEMLPKDLRQAFFNGDATMMIALFDNTTSSETSMEAVISTLVVLFILPAMFMIFDPLICHTSIGFAKKKPAKEKKQ